MFFLLRHWLVALLLVTLLTGCTGMKPEESITVENNSKTIIEEPISSQSAEESNEKEKEKQNTEKETPAPSNQQQIADQSTNEPVEKRTEASEVVSAVANKQPVISQAKMESSSNQQTTPKLPTVEPAKNSQPEGTFKNGTYKGSSEGNEGTIEVQVSVINNYLNQIVVLAHEDTKNLADNAFTLLSKRMIEQQNIDVEVIAGATASSKGFMNAVKNALK